MTDMLRDEQEQWAMMDQFADRVTEWLAKQRGDLTASHPCGTMGVQSDVTEEADAKE